MIHNCNPYGNLYFSFLVIHGSFGIAAAFHISLRASATSAGFGVLRVISEAPAACLAYGTWVYHPHILSPPKRCSQSTDWFLTPAISQLIGCLIMSMQHVQYVLLFLVLPVIFKFYGVTRSYSSCPFLCTLAWGHSSLGMWAQCFTYHPIEFNFYAYLVASYPGHPLKSLGMRLGRCADWRMMA